MPSRMFKPTHHDNRIGLRRPPDPLYDRRMARPVSGAGAGRDVRRRQSSARRRDARTSHERHSRGKLGKARESVENSGSSKGSMWVRSFAPRTVGFFSCDRVPFLYKYEFSVLFLDFVDGKLPVCRIVFVMGKRNVDEVNMVYSKWINLECFVIKRSACLCLCQ